LGNVESVTAVGVFVSVGMSNNFSSYQTFATITTSSTFTTYYNPATKEI